MHTTTRQATRDRGGDRRAGPWCRAFVGLLLLIAAGPARADEPPVEGLFITVPNPITSDVTARVRDTTERFLDRWKDRPAAERPAVKIVYDFNPDGRPSSSGDFGACYQLADYLLHLPQATAIAFVQNEVTRHTVLPVLACRQVVFAPDGKLGNVLADQSEVLTPTKLQAYREVARGRGLAPALVLKMLDKELSVVESRTAKGNVWYHDTRLKKEEIEKEIDERGREKVTVTQPEPVLPAGATKLYTAPEAEKFGLCQLIREKRQDVARTYGLPASSLREDALMGRNPVVWRIEVRGPVNKALEETLTRRIRKAIGHPTYPANLIILELHCGGGDTVVAADLAKFFSELKDDRGERPVMTVAYVPERAPDTAVYLALGCSEIVLHKNAELGDFSSIVTERRNGARVDFDPAEFKMKLETLEGLADAQGYPKLLVRGMMDRQAEIYQATHRKDSERQYVTKEELEADKKDAEKNKTEPKWINERLIKKGGPGGDFLIVKGQDANKDDAVKLGLARYAVQDLREVYAHYGVSPDNVHSARSDWLDEVAAFLTQPVVSVFLVMVGITCLILELKMPGIGLPGVMAAVCFVLFFWAHSQFAGQITMLAVLLFALGLILIALEIFVLPGFGVAGISGLVLVIGSLGLVAYGHWPQTSDEWVGFGEALGPFGLSLLGAVVAAFLLGRYLPSIPLVNRLILKPQAEAAELTGEESASPLLHPDYGPLLGAIGVAATPLRPAGKAKFGDDYLDVVAEGSYVVPGTRVQVIEVEGNRIVVKEVT